jgi:hypothetical protein
MADKPILFSGPMVRALIAGTKTQTRRALKPQPVQNSAGLWTWQRRGVSVQGEGLELALALRIAVGDRLYVRETWQALSFGDYLPTKCRTCDLRFAATDTLGSAPKDIRGYPWRPGIHMPRWASRLTLTVTDVRVERLQEISVGDAVAEGALSTADVDQFAEVHALPMYRAIWTGINGPGSWEANPWVAAYTFTVEHGNIDALARAA